MKDMMYNILWIDDEHEDYIPFKGQAKRNNISLIPFKSLNAGMDELKKNYSFYDGVLLDAKILEHEYDEPGTEDIKYVHRAKEQLDQLSEKKKFEVFVLTGQAEAFGNKTFRDMYLKVYEKGVDDDITQLFSDLKDAASNLDDYQLKHQYNNILKICDDKYIGKNQFERVFSLIKDIDNKYGIEKTGDLLTPIRKIIEVLFCRLGELGIIPNEILDANGWINGSSRFLADKDDNYIHLSNFIHPLLSENIHRILKITQDASHGEGELKYRVDEYLQNNSCDFLYKSTVYLLFDILMWFKDFIDNNPDVDENRKLWKKKVIEEKDWILGCVIRIDENNWGIFQPINTTDEITIHWKMVVDKELEKGDYIKVITEPSPDGSKLHIKAISKDV